MVKLSGLEIFFIVTTIVSLVINIIQFLKINPVYNSLCGLMNDCHIKAKYYSEQSGNGRSDIMKKIVADLDGFGQQIYGIMKAIRKKDKFFRAYSLTKEAKFTKKP
jgi:hypothetical protein